LNRLAALLEGPEGVGTTAAADVVNDEAEVA
jgi:hypothetical protein